MRRLIFTLAVFLAVAAMAVTEASETKKKRNAVFLDVNPHRAMFRKEKINEQICLLCHSVTPTAHPKEAGAVEQLNDSIGKVCFGCHGVRPHVGAREHLGKLSKKMLKRKAAWEKKNKKHIPLFQGKRGTCVTCHDPHPYGLLKKLDAETYKGRTMPSQYRLLGEKTKTDLFKINISKVERFGLEVKKRPTPLNSQELPFRGDVKNGDFCKVCHDLR